MDRGVNYTVDEKFNLTTIIASYARIIECKKTNGASKTEKADAWKCITDEYNRHDSFRHEKSLMGCWTNLKKFARKYLAAESRENRKTGGGINTFKKDPLLEEVLKIVGRHIEPLPNPFDDDNDVSTVEEILKNPPSGDNTSSDVYDYLLQENFVGDWRTWSSNNAKKPIAHPLHEIIKKAAKPNSKTCTAIARVDEQLEDGTNASSSSTDISPIVNCRRNSRDDNMVEAEMGENILEVETEKEKVQEVAGSLRVKKTASDFNTTTQKEKLKMKKLKLRMDSKELKLENLRLRNELLTVQLKQEKLKALKMKRELEAQYPLNEEENEYLYEALDEDLCTESKIS